MERRKFTREFKLEAVRLIKDRGVSYVQASQDLNVHPSQLRPNGPAIGSCLLCLPAISGGLCHTLNTFRFDIFVTLPGMLCASVARLVPLALLLGTSSALVFDTSELGQGSLPLDERTAVIAKSARLQQEINVVLSGGNKKQEDVTCFGMRFPGQWKHLGGLRVSPYTCDFGAMWLTITDKAMPTQRHAIHASERTTCCT